MQQTKATSSGEYDEKWVKETWGWDTPDEFIRTKGQNLRPRVKYCVEIANLKQGMRVLDVGCGRGEVILHCGMQGIYGVGVDYSEYSIDIANKAKANCSVEANKYMHFLKADVKDIHEDEKFDRIFLLDLVEHLYDWELNILFEKCWRLLTPDGMIIIHTLPNKWLYEITYRRILRIFLPHLPVNPRSEKEKLIHVNEMSIIHLNQLLISNGFQCRIWLDELITKQAKWHSKGGLHDKRSSLYRWMEKPAVALIYRLLCNTPLRLLIANDIFALAVKNNNSYIHEVKMTTDLIEKTVLSIAKQKKDAIRIK